ncbi:MAG TPA: Vms1/Ankzf1 family peptidyl-tRNA hydrolase [Ardenticatenaceae bacterium]
MLDSAKLSKLSEYRNGDAPVMSMYLPVDRDSPQDKHLIHFKNLRQEAEQHKEQYSNEVWQQVEANLDRAERWLRDNETDVRGGEGVAIFASGEKLWQTVVVPYELDATVTLGDSPRLRPLYRLLQRFERYLVILSDARDARVFVITPDETSEVAQVEDDTPNRHQQGGWAQSKLQRHQDKMVDEHLENAADIAFNLFQRRGFDGVILMGTEDRTNRLSDLLHPYLRQRELARTAMDTTASANEVAERALELAREGRRERQSELLKHWEDGLGGVATSVGGIPDTLEAAQEGKLMTLFMREDLTAPGSICTQCEALTAKTSGKCDYCGGELRRVDDLTEALTAAAISQGAELVFLAADGEANRLNDQEGVGAILRYATTPATTG